MTEENKDPDQGMSPETEEDKSTPSKNRRAFLAAGAVLAPAFALAARNFLAFESEADEPIIVPPKNPGASAGVIPNVPVQTHTGRDALFYDDLVQNKIVSINFMSVRGDEGYPVTDNLVQVQRLLGDRVGRDLYMYSISVDPEHDTPEVLNEFTKRKGVGPGWEFVTGKKAAIDLLRTFLFVRRNPASGFVHTGPHAGPDCSMGLARYGNEALGRWGSYPMRITPESIAERFSWIGFREQTETQRG